MTRVEPDKLRFCDPDALATDNLAGEFLVHAVELSDERSRRQFVTIWTKKKRREWAEQMPDHDPDIYHREAEAGLWQAECYPGRTWANAHYHLLLDHPPRFADLQPFAEHMSAALRQELEEHLGNGAGTEK